MDWSLLLIDAVPLLAFVLLDTFSTPRKAVIGALVVSAPLVAYEVYRFGAVDEFTLLSAFLIAVLGGLSLRFDNAVFFKFKPVLFDAIGAAVLVGSYLLDRPLLVTAMTRYGPHMLPEPYLSQLQQPRFLAVLALCTLYMGIGLLLHAGIVAWAALRLGTWGWYWTRLVSGGFIQIAAVVLAAASFKP